MNICQYCGKPYKARKDRPNSKFCCFQCRKSANQGKAPYICDYCGKEFLVSKIKIKRKKEGLQKSICCSKECFDELQGPSFSEIKSLFGQKQYILKTDHKLKAKEKYEYVCPIHPDKPQFITYNNLKQGNGCYFCGITSTAEKRRTSYDKVKKAFNRHDMFLLEQEYRNSSTPMKYICYHHKEKGIQRMTYSNAQRQHCPYCNRSKGETKVAELLRKYHLSYIEQMHFNGLTGVGGGLLSYDFYIPSEKILIEFQGEYHDGTASN